MDSLLHSLLNKKSIAAASVAALFLFPLQLFAATLTAGFFVDGVAGGKMTESQPARWEFSFKDSVTGATPHFHVMHEKPMHLIVISDDLSHFAHVHPDLKPRDPHQFSLSANTENADPDNFAVHDVVPFAGHFLLFAEVMAMDYGMLLFPFDLNVDGVTRPAEPMVVDPREADGSIVKTFADGLIRAKLLIDPMNHCDIVLPHFNMKLEVQGADGTYSPLNDLEPWLASYGHAIVVGQKGSLAAEKIVQHLHAVWPIPGDDPSKDVDRGPLVELAAHSHGKSTPTDVYRTWIQIKRAGQVYTLPFTFTWDLVKASGFAKSDGAFCFGR
jgi:hypothetical protein